MLLAQHFDVSPRLVFCWGRLWIPSNFKLKGCAVDTSTRAHSFGFPIMQSCEVAIANENAAVMCQRAVESVRNNEELTKAAQLA